MIDLARFSRPPVVIAGCGRSGTTVLLSMLSAHHSIYAIPDETGLLCPTGYEETPDLSLQPDLFGLYRLLAGADLPPSCTRWCEKTPRNILYLKPILEFFGADVRIIQIVRDGRDVVTSVHPSNNAAYHVTAGRWIGDVAAGLPYEKHESVLTVRYEDLVLEYERTTGVRTWRRGSAAVRGFLP